VINQSWIIDFSQCMCDITQGGCDANCCCDSDCSS
jgi:hypothetical protein